MRITIGQLRELVAEARAAGKKKVSSSTRGKKRTAATTETIAQEMFLALFHRMVGQLEISFDSVTKGIVTPEEAIALADSARTDVQLRKLAMAVLHDRRLKQMISNVFEEIVQAIDGREGSSDEPGSEGEALSRDYESWGGNEGAPHGAGRHT